MKISFYSQPKLDPAKHYLVRISLYHPRFSKLRIDRTVLELAPTKEILELADQPATYRRHYRKRLDALGVNGVRAIFDSIRKDAGKREPVLLCFENPEKFPDALFYCHRQLLAEWWEKHTGEVIPEL